MINRCSCGRPPRVLSSLFKEFHECLPGQSFKQYHFRMRCYECGFMTEYRKTLDEMISDWNSGNIKMQSRHRRVK